MQKVVTEELRNAGALGRELVEAEEAVDVALCVEEQLRITDMQKNAVQMQPKILESPQTRVNALAESLLDPNISPGPETTASIRALARNAHRTVLTGEPSQSAKLSGPQPSAKDFLSRDYHSMQANRFLFSCADEYDSCARNKSGVWTYTLPESASGSSSLT